MIDGSRAIACLTGKVGIWLALVWGFAEGTLFFLIPDIIVTFAALFAPRKSGWHLGAVVLGSLIAGAIMFAWGSRDPQAARAAVDRVPFVTAQMFKTVEADYPESGVLALLKGPMSGIPYKAYAVLAPSHEIGLGTFLLVSIPARLERLVITWVLFGIAGLALRKVWERNPALGIGLHAAYWIVIYIIYWSKIG